MHLLGLNWQLQEAENVAFENGQPKSDTAPTNAVTVLSADGGKRRGQSGGQVKRLGLQSIL